MEGLQCPYRLNKCRGKYDGISSRLTTLIFRKWLEDFNGGERIKSNQLESICIEGIEFDITATIYFDKVEDTLIEGFEILGSTGADPDDEEKDGSFKTPYIFIDFAIKSTWLPQYWQEIYMFLADCVRHEIEHITQGGEDSGNYRTGKPYDDDYHLRILIKRGFLPEYQYLLLPKEVDANIQGLRFESKKRREPISKSVNRYLDIKNLSGEERNKVMEVWRSRAKQIGGIPIF